MRRREFIALLGGAAAAWPTAARAQQAGMPVVGAFGLGSRQSNAGNMSGLRQGINENGYVEGRSLVVDEQWVGSQYDRLAEVAADFVRRRVDVIFAAGNAMVARAAQAATRTIPIVFGNGSDPVQVGLVASMNRPGGNITGVSFLVAELEPKKLQLIHELVPQALTIAVLVNPTNPATNPTLHEIEAAARKIGRTLVVVTASSDTEIDKAFATMAQNRVGALLINIDSFLASRRAHIAALASRYGIPAITSNRQFVDAGGLMSYGDNRSDSWRLAGLYIGRILKGEKPSDLPVMQPTKFELIVSLKASRAIGLTIPETFLARADKVIE